MSTNVMSPCVTLWQTLAVVNAASATDRTMIEATRVGLLRRRIVPNLWVLGQGPGVCCIFHLYLILSGATARFRPNKTTNELK